MRYALVALAIVALLVVISRSDAGQAGGYFTVTVRTVNLKPAAATDNGAAVSEAGTLVDVSHTKQGSLSDVVTISETSTSSDVRRTNASDVVAISESSTRSDIRRPTRTDTGATVAEVNVLTRVSPAPTSTPGNLAPMWGHIPVDSTFTNYVSWVGCTVPIGEAYNGQGTSWANQFDIAGTLSEINKSGEPVMISLRVYPSSDSSGNAGMTDIISGAGDSSIRSAATQILAQDPPARDGNIYIRIFWETPDTNTGDWSGASVGNWVAAFKHVADLFHQSSPKFKMIWDIAPWASTSQAQSLSYYPGDAYVDVIGQDEYPDTTSMSPAAAWSGILSGNGNNGLTWVASFASQHGKLTSIDEWGFNSDNAGPLITSLKNWAAASNTRLIMYFDGNWSVNNYLDGNQYPTAGAIYKSYACVGN